MTFTIGERKLTVMPTQQEKEITVSQGTAISIGLALPLIAATITAVTILVTTQTKLNVLQNDMANMRTEIKEYVKREELILRLDGLDNRLKGIESAIIKNK
jgi:hypothetical protein